MRLTGKGWDKCVQFEARCMQRHLDPYAPFFQRFSYYIDAQKSNVVVQVVHRGEIRNIRGPAWTIESALRSLIFDEPMENPFDKIISFAESVLCQTNQ